MLRFVRYLVLPDFFSPCRTRRSYILTNPSMQGDADPAIGDAAEVA